MTGRAGWGLSAQQRTELWERWRSGESINDIARALDKRASSIYDALRKRGGVYRPPRRRAVWCLTLAEREEISRGIISGRSIRQIARALGRAPSTVSREIARNGGRRRYRAAQADHAAWHRAKRAKPCKLALNPRLRRIVAYKLRLQWSPEQIAGWLSRTFPDDESLHVSHETIYKTLFVQSRGLLKKELLLHLRSRRKIRRGKTASTKGQRRGQIVDAISIRERPATVEDRAVAGHWEGDLLAGSGNSHIATLVERSTRFVMLIKLDSRDTETVVAALARKIRRLPAELRRSLTWDRGVELAQHHKFTVATDVKVYFCDPHKPWQRGSNENTNGLLRQYFPKGTDLSVHSQAHLNKIAKRLNQRPRKTLDFDTPANKLNECVASTG